MALMKMPPALNELGITVMDGPFFSLMPFPARSLHTLSHVRYTPHFSWQDTRVSTRMRNSGRILKSPGLTGWYGIVNVICR